MEPEAQLKINQKPENFLQRLCKYWTDFMAKNKLKLVYSYSWIAWARIDDIRECFAELDGQCTLAEFWSFMPKRKYYIPEHNSLLMICTYLSLIRVVRLSDKKAKDYWDVLVFNSLPVDGICKVIEDEGTIKSADIEVTEYKDGLFT